MAFRTHPLSIGRKWTFETIQIYDKPEETFENRDLMIEETAKISFHGGILRLDLSWTTSMPDEEQRTVTESYQFCRDGNGNGLVFTRINSDSTAEGSLAFVVLKALYR